MDTGMMVMTMTIKLGKKTLSLNDKFLNNSIVRNFLSQSTASIMQCSKDEIKIRWPI